MWALRLSKDYWLLEVCIELRSSWPFTRLADSYLMRLLASTSSSDHFPISHIFCIPQYLSYVSSCMLCAMRHLCIPTILRGLLLCHFLMLIHRVWLPQRGCRIYLLSLSYSPKNQSPCGPFFHSCYNIRWSRGFLLFLYSLSFLSFTQICCSMTILATPVSSSLEDFHVLVLLLFSQI